MKGCSFEANSFLLSEQTNSLSRNLLPLDQYSLCLSLSLSLSLSCCTLFAFSRTYEKSIRKRILLEFCARRK